MQFDQLKRRQFITLLGGAAAWPLAARAQQAERVRRIGVLMNLAADDPEGQSRLAAFLRGLQQLGWSDGGNVRIDTRWAAADVDRFRRQAMLGKSAGVGQVARTTGLTRQTIYRIKDDPVAAEAALATWGL
jgi:hypothetical protein